MRRKLLLRLRMWASRHRTYNHSAVAEFMRSRNNYPVKPSPKVRRHGASEVASYVLTKEW